jgi:hypothetical protein
MKEYKIEWTCRLCGQKHEFSRSLTELDDWPNKFDDLECENQECRMSQDVAVRSCTITPVS